ncbi:hypothetical protein KDA_35100 [Dictyobacter alpinus]|uniref:Protein kinase domain-containing protein n=1 Tax=Dictyobacter alpinus TaxID=2014873 RepID=A0A402B9L6_9CHLR|nr:WD40 repeat domain-containing serine/threonine protein kinase [Dictyobacter alpinus]GCE28026.1 hypothetical protein KDA_35100 [Dictyobacter alpinus]
MGAERYTLKKTLPSGHMSEVWLAQDRESGRDVVVKIMKVHEGDEKRNQKTEERFAREITILQGLSHPQILPLLDSGYRQYKQRRVPFLVSPYIEEGSLATLMNQRPPWQSWSLRQVADAVMQAADCLWYLHNQNPQIVHEDVKPGNFLYRSINTPERAVYLYLFDFGISRYKHQSFEMASEIVGTPAFMAPEQIGKEVDSASDQYALAVMACVLLTGKFPIQNTDQNQQHYLLAHLNTPPLPPSSLLPERLQSPEIDAVFLRALEKQPEQRYSSVMGFAHALQQAIYAYGEEKTEPNPGAISHEARFSLSLDSSDVQEVRTLDDPLPIKPPRAIVPERQEGLILQPLLLQGPTRVAFASRPKTLSWSPDGSSLACVLYGTVYIYWPGSGALSQVLTPNAARASAVCWSADSQVLAVAGNHKICFWQVGDARLLPQVLQLALSMPQGLDWSVRDQLAIWVDTELWIYHLPLSRLQQVRVQAPQHLSTGGMRCDNPGTLHWSPDGTQLAIGSSQGNIACWPVGGKQAVWQVASLGHKIQGLCWSRDGAQLVVATNDRRVLGWQVQERTELLRWEKLPSLIRMLTISRQGRITLASSEKRLLLGSPYDPAPTLSAPGQLMAAWSPVRDELATLDDHDANTLTVWSE